jgi:collagenase-like PrtC family protease
MLVKDEKQHLAFNSLAQQVERIEINSPAFLALAQCYPTVIGSFLNVYNSATARILAEKLIERIVLPCELSLESIRCISERSPVATEVIVHGHIPIAVSTSCPTARTFGRNSKQCEMLCRRYPEGMVLEAGDRPMFRIEGPQTLSAATYCLLEYLSELDKAGVDTIRILPQLGQTASVLRIYREVLDHRRETHDALEELKALSSGSLCNGWFLGKAG